LAVIAIEVSVAGTASTAAITFLSTSLLISGMAINQTFS
jgi:hypothetical protein